MSEPDTTNQAEYAKDLCDYINEEVFAGEGRGITAADVLDALGSIGLKLVEDLAGDASTAYLLTLIPETP
jgi:hypothetical protein